MATSTTTASETRASETTASETTASETTASETTASETTASETTASETTASETTASETTASETTASETTTTTELAVVAVTYDTTTGQTLFLALGWLFVIACIGSAAVVGLGRRDNDHWVKSSLKTSPATPKTSISLASAPGGEQEDESLEVLRRAHALVNVDTLVKTAEVVGEQLDQPSGGSPAQSKGRRPEPVALGGVITAVAGLAAIWGINDETVSGNGVIVVAVLLVLLVAGVTLYQRWRVTPTEAPQDDQGRPMVPVRRRTK